MKVQVKPLWSCFIKSDKCVCVHMHTHRVHHQTETAVLLDLLPPELPLLYDLFYLSFLHICNTRQISKQRFHMPTELFFLEMLYISNSVYTDQIRPFVTCGTCYSFCLLNSLFHNMQWLYLVITLLKWADKMLL